MSAYRRAKSVNDVMNYFGFISPFMFLLSYVILKLLENFEPSNVIAGYLLMFIFGTTSIIAITFYIIKKLKSKRDLYWKIS